MIIVHRKNPKTMSTKPSDKIDKSRVESKEDSNRERPKLTINHKKMMEKMYS